MTKYAVLIHENNNNFYWTLIHYCPYFLAVLWKYYYDCKNIPCVLRTEDSINYQINKKII